MFTKRKRTVTIVLFSVCLNTGLFLLAHFCRLPLWLDTTGTVYVTMMLGFAAGFLVGLINNVTLSLFFYGFDSFTYYLVSAATALGTSLYVKYRYAKGKPQNAAFAVILSLFLFCIGISFAVPITLLADGGVPADLWGGRLYSLFTGRRMLPAAATILSVSLIKLPDIAVTVVIVMLVHRLTPKRYKCDEFLIQ